MTRRRRRVIFPPADYWTRQRKDTNVTDEHGYNLDDLDTAQIGIALVEAEARGDRQTATLIMGPYLGTGVDCLPLLQYLTGLIVAVAKHEYGSADPLVRAQRLRIMQLIGELPTEEKDTHQ